MATKRNSYETILSQLHSDLGPLAFAKPVHVNRRFGGGILHRIDLGAPYEDILLSLKGGQGILDIKMHEKAKGTVSIRFRTTTELGTVYLIPAAGNDASE